MAVQPTSGLLSAANSAASSAADGAKNAAFCAAISSGIGSGYKIVARRNGEVVLSLTMSGSLSSSGAGLAIPNSYGSLNTLLAADIDTGTWTLRIEKASDPAVYLEGTLGRSGTDFQLSDDLDPATGISISGLFLASPQIDTATVPSAGYVDTMISDMKWFHDAPIEVLRTDGGIPGWGSGVGWPESRLWNTQGWNSPVGNMWFHCGETTPLESLRSSDRSLPWRAAGPYTGNDATNTRVQIKHLQLWHLVGGTWVRSAYTEAPAGFMYPINWVNAGSKQNTTRRVESSGGASVKDIGRGAYDKFCWHGWTATAAEPASATACATACFGRKILDNPSGPDDRSQAQLVMGVAGDIYMNYNVGRTIDPQWPDNLQERGFSRMKLLTNDWQLFSWYTHGTLSESQLRSNPPPFTGL